jgi:transcriptional regulator with XRE-family HTH domain
MKIDNRKLDLIMAAQCLTAEQLSTVTGVSQVSISRFRRGIQQPRPATIGRIAKALNVSVTDIIVTPTAMGSNEN